MEKTIIYIGGYQSSGYKAEYIEKKLNHKLVVFAPDYDNEKPEDISGRIVEAIKTALKSQNQVEIIGSSTGGMTALLLQPYFNFKMYLINPLLAKEQFFDQEHPVGPNLDPVAKKLHAQDFSENKVNIYLGVNDELLNPEYTRQFAKEKNIEIIEFKGDHAGVECLDLIIEEINKN